MSALQALLLSLQAATGPSEGAGGGGHVRAGGSGRISRRDQRGDGRGQLTPMLGAICVVGTSFFNSKNEF
jgi:hypothetical protein